MSEGKLLLCEESEAFQRAKDLFNAQKLEERVVLIALLDGDLDFVKAALCLLAKAKIAMVERLIAARASRGLAALCWKAGLSPQAAVQVQLILGGIAREDTIKPVDQKYAMSAAEMERHFLFFSVLESPPDEKKQQFF